MLKNSLCKSIINNSIILIHQVNYIISKLYNYIFI